MVLFLLLQGTTLIFAQNPEAFIREMTGTVELKAGGAANWIPAKTGDRLERATIISTGFKSSALLTVGNSTMMVRPLTRLSLDALLLDRDNVETINVGLRTGRIQVNMNPPAGSRTNYTVQTPAVTASVRGTEFSMDPVNLVVLEGMVSFVPTGGKAAKGSTSVYAGQSTWVDTDSGKAVNPLTAAETMRGLPALPGQSSGQSSGKESAPRLQTPRGTFEINLTLESRE